MLKNIFENNKYLNIKKYHEIIGTIFTMNNNILLIVVNDEYDKQDINNIKKHLIDIFNEDNNIKIVNGYEYYKLLIELSDNDNIYDKHICILILNKKNIFEFLKMNINKEYNYINLIKINNKFDCLNLKNLIDLNNN